MAYIRNLPDTFDSDVVTEIDGRLDDICKSQGVHIPLAVESGSRAWVSIT